MHSIPLKSHSRYLKWAVKISNFDGTTNKFDICFMYSLHMHFSFYSLLRHLNVILLFLYRNSDNEQRISFILWHNNIIAYICWVHGQTNKCLIFKVEHFLLSMKIVTTEQEGQREKCSIWLLLYVQLYLHLEMEA